MAKTWRPLKPRFFVLAEPITIHHDNKNVAQIGDVVAHDSPSMFAVFTTAAGCLTAAPNIKVISPSMYILVYYRS